MSVQEVNSLCEEDETLHVLSKLDESYDYDA